jgi:hypothetical protein
MFKTPLVKEDHEINLGLENYAVIKRIEKNNKFNSKKLNTLQ